MRKLFNQISRFFYWGWKLRNNHDFDGGYIYEMLELKLKRMKKACYENGHRVWSEKSREYKAIVECIELCKKLGDEEHPYYEMFEKEFGPGLDYEFKDVGNGFTQLIDSNTPFYQKQRTFVFRKRESLQKARRERLFHLLNKWLPYWWD